MDKCNLILKETLKMSSKMKEMALKGEKEEMDIKMLRLCGMIRSISSKIAFLAKKEIEQHQLKEKWN